MRAGQHFIDKSISLFNVMRAVALRDMRTRFFNHGLGFLLVSIWPLAHLLILLSINTAMGRRPPYGDDMLLFLSTGLIPTLVFMYVSRFMALSLLLNRPMMAFPIVHAVDILIARAFLESIAAIITLVLLLMILSFLGSDIRPESLESAVLGYAVTLMLAIGTGILAGVISMCFQFFITLYFLLMIVVYISSGTLFVLPALPERVAYILSWLPVVQCVEWMRSSYYPTYDEKYLDKPYLIVFSLTTLFLGLALERLLRRRIME